LNAAASKAHVFPGMANHYLLSVGQLCNEGYIVTFKNASVTVCNSQEFQILSDPRPSGLGHWTVAYQFETSYSTCTPGCRK
jgi:hypothetical protein